MSEEEIPVLTAAPNEEAGMLGRLSDSYWGVLITLFLVTGCLGLPLLLSSNRFTKKEKWFWGVTNTLYTLSLIAGVAWLIWSVYQMVARLTLGGP